MNIEPLPISGAFHISTSRHEDDRGYFARAWCQRDFETAGLNVEFVQTSLSFNRLAGTFRGMHYQDHPYGENKLVRCVRGSIVDIILDLRPESSTFLQHEQITLSADNQEAVLVPIGCAHGFLTLEDESEVLYMIDRYYEPSASIGVRWDDPAFGIILPQDIQVIHDRDATYPTYQVPK